MDRLLLGRSTDDQKIQKRRARGLQPQLPPRDHLPEPVNPRFWDD